MKHVDKRNSLGIYVLRYVLGIYTVITVLITVFLLVNEYLSIKKRVIENIVTVQDTFYDTFADAMWQINRVQIKSIASGLVQGDGVVGLKFIHPEKDDFFKIGTYATDETTREKTKQDSRHLKIINGELFQVDIKDGGFFDRLFEVRFELYRKSYNQANAPVYVGTGSIYTSNAKILDKVKYGFYLIIVSSFIKTIILWILFYAIITYLVSQPLSKLTQSILAIDPKKPQSDGLLELLGKRKDELGIFAQSFGNMIVSIHNNIEVIQDLNTNLEKKVEQRTIELASKNKDIESILTNIKQGIFTFNESIKIQSQYSKYLESIFKKGDLTGLDPVELLFANSNVSTNDIDQVKTIIKSCVGLDEFAFSVNAHLLVREYKYEAKTLELDWEPILGQDNMTIVKVMVVVRDVTELRKLQDEIQKSNLELQKIGQILKVGVEKFLDFSNRSMEFIAENKKVLSVGSKDIALLFRNMHTIKGNARTLQLTDFVNSVHLVEQFYQNIRDNKTSWDQEKIESDLLFVEGELKSYGDIIKTKLVGMNTPENDQLAKLIDEKIEKDEFTREDFNEIKKIRLKSKYDDLKNILIDEINTIGDIAKSIGKSVPEFIFNESVLVSRKYASVLKDIFTHLFRNNIDHGIEATEKRISTGKKPQGEIKVSTFIENDYYCIHLNDDGLGLNLEAIKNKSGKKDSNLGDLDYAYMIFNSGVSTAANVTDISGRGVGMDAVKSFIEKLGGSIEINFTENKQTNGHRAFTFILKFPRDFARA